ncbi:MAG: hypothetical protein ACK4RK_20160 [Gemmataceae bacterium]
MTALERHQIPIYFATVLLGSAVGLLLPDSASALEMLIWPVVGTLLYFTFLQVPLIQFRQALADGRFLAAMLTANFVFVPLVVWLLLKALPPSPPILLGVALVLLTPCTDWMNTFTLLGKGDAHRTLAATPLLLVTQILLLPLFLWLMLESHTSRMVATWPVVLLAVTVLVIAASQIQQVLENARQLTLVTLIFVVYVVLAAFLVRLAHRQALLAATENRPRSDFQHRHPQLVRGSSAGLSTSARMETRCGGDRDSSVRRNAGDACVHSPGTSVPLARRRCGLCTKPRRRDATRQRRRKALRKR